MTLYVLFAGLGILIYTGVALAQAAASTLSSARIASGLQFAFFASLSMATGDPEDAPTCAGPCGAGGEAIAGEAIPILQNGFPTAVVRSESARALAAGMTLFQKRGCAGCHQPDGTGVGPTLHGLSGSPVQYPGSGSGIVDESYLREAILNPSATAAIGFTPVMPTFAGQFTEDELQALIVYVTSLSVPVQINHR